MFERRAADPALPLPLCLQAVVGFTATCSGEVLVPLTISVMLGAIISGASLEKTGY